MTVQFSKNPVASISTNPPWKRGFWSLFVTQFQGAFSDNVFKWLVIFIIIRAGLTEEQSEWLVPLTMAVFSLPFILFSMAGGFLADRYSKRSVTIGTKVAEVITMTLALVGLAFNNIPLLLVVVFLMSTQSAFFGPAKYGLLPELLHEKRLSWGNGILGLGTFVAIIAGTAAAGWLSVTYRDQQWSSGVILIGLGCLGLLASLGINRLPAANATKRFRANFLGDLITQFGIIRKNRVLFLAIFGSSYFWFLGALLQPSILIYGKAVLHLDDLHSSYLQVALAIGIGIGCFAAGYLSGKKIEYGLVPLGAMGMTVFAAVVSRPELTFNIVALNLGLLGFFAGFFIVPINALIQHLPDSENKGTVIATSAWFSSLGVFLAAGVYYLLARVADLSPPEIFLTCALMTLAGTVYAIYLLPDSLLRLLFWMLTNSIYRIRVEGRDNIPEKGGALFVCNHLSQVDAFLLLASTDRFIRFLMYKGIYDQPWFKPFARILKVIPISSESRPRELIQSLKEAGESIKQGEVVCIFAEGQITRIGQMLPFRKGFTRIMKDVDAPIIPVNLDSVWGSIFSFEKKRFLWKIPRKVPFPVTVSYGKPMPANSEPFKVRQAVQELGAEAWDTRKPRMRTLHRSFVRTARSHPLRFSMADARVSKISLGSALTGTIFLGRRLKETLGEPPMVGILLPPSASATLVNYAILLMGKIPVNLNYTLTDDAIASCVRQCEIQTIITSKTFLDHLKLKIPARAVLMEELAEKPGLGEKLNAFIMAWFLPVGILEKLMGRRKRISIDDLATIIFSSGSTGDPKGVMLTHYNIQSNIEQLAQVFALDSKERFLGVLPFFHSFGFTATLCLPMTLGAGVVYHPNPLDARAIGKLAAQYAVTFLLATPTFLQIYMRGCTPEQFGSIQFVLVGAEKLTEKIALAFEEKFRIRPMEAYGCTECAPGVTVNTRDFRSAGFRQLGSKRGKIGHPLPGISVKIVNPDTMEELPVKQTGLLLVRGPNVMKGYLGNPEKTAEVLRDGWYVTGDIAMLDEDGFLEITDRLSRFSKIGGEMVPHIKVEEKLHDLAGSTEQTFAVSGVPDERKGERLVVLHTLSQERLKTLLQNLPQLDLPNLWLPRKDQFFFVEEIPYLGTGKLDLRKIRDLATQFSSSS